MVQPCLLKPLIDLLAAPSGRKMEVVWPDVALHAFTAAKEAMANATLLLHPVLKAPTSIMTDASDVAIGAVEQQFVGDERRPIAYFSRKFKPAETRYSTFDRKLLAIYLAISCCSCVRTMHTYICIASFYLCGFDMKL